VQEKIGEGSFGEVFKVKRRKDDAMFALKLIGNHKFYHAISLA